MNDSICNPLYNDEKHSKDSRSSSTIEYNRSTIDDVNDGDNYCLSTLTCTKFAIRWKSLRQNKFIDKNGNIILNLHDNLYCDRQVFVKNFYKNRFLERSGESSRTVYYTYEISYQRYIWKILRSFPEFKKLHKTLLKKYPHLYTDKYKHLFEHMTSPSYFIENLVIRGRFTYSGLLGLRISDIVEERRWKGLCTYLQLLCDEKEFFDCLELKLFMGIGITSFRADLGRKGFAGHLKKPKTFGGVLPEWTTNRILEFLYENCWVALHDNCIGIYQHNLSEHPIEVIEVEADFCFIRMVSSASSINIIIIIIINIIITTIILRVVSLR